MNVAVDPGMTRNDALEQAEKIARLNDEDMAYRVAQDLLPRASALQKYEMRAHQLNTAFKTPESPSIIGRMRP